MGCLPCFGSSSEEVPMREENRGKGKSGKEVLAAPASQRISKISAELEEKIESKFGSESKKEEPSPRDSRSLRVESRLFTLEELAAATQNFRQDCLLGEGGFGRVYKGYLNGTGQVVAVKRLNQNGLQGNREFLTEVLMLSLLHHPNLVKMIGYCSDGDQRLLVYEFMPLGSLEDHLHDIGPDKVPLDWNTRMKIAVGAAKGLEYLHNEANPPVIYRDMKSSNILLGEGYFPKLSDFGLAKLGPVGDKTHVSTRVMGTYGYCAPEYAMTGQLTMKSDVYSFGVLFLEIITGHKAIDYTRAGGEQNLVSWARPLFRDRKNFTNMADPLLQGRYPMRGLYQALAVAAMCVQEQAAARPLIADVVSALTYLASQTYDPNSAASQTDRVSHTQKKKEHRKNRSIGSDNGHVARSSSHHSPDSSKNDSGRSHAGADSGGKQEMDGSQMADNSEKDSSGNARKMRESPRNVNQDNNRERAVAEAKLWGENWRKGNERMDLESLVS